jgi:hypothetical protein
MAMRVSQEQNGVKRVLMRHTIGSMAELSCGLEGDAKIDQLLQE